MRIGGSAHPMSAVAVGEHERETVATAHDEAGAEHRRRAAVEHGGGWPSRRPPSRTTAMRSASAAARLRSDTAATTSLRSCASCGPARERALMAGVEVDRGFIEEQDVRSARALSRGRALALAAES